MPPLSSNSIIIWESVVPNLSSSRKILISSRRRLRFILTSIVSLVLTERGGGGFTRSSPSPINDSRRINRPSNSSMSSKSCRPQSSVISSLQLYNNYNNINLLRVLVTQMFSLLLNGFLNSVNSKTRVTRTR